MPSVFLDFLQRNRNRQINNGFLDLMHTTEMLSGIPILKSGSLNTSPCPVFRKDLLYLFYGRPSFRTHSIKEGEYTSDKAYFPICFVFDIDKLTTLKPSRSFPFDSGGFSAGYFKTNNHFDLKIVNFDLGKDLFGVKEVINFFFKNDAHYFSFKPKELINNDKWPDEIKYYYDLISTTGTTKFDERCSSLELIFSDPIELKNLKMVVLPDQDVDEVKLILDRHGIDCQIEHYRLGGRTNPNDYMGNIKEIVYDLLFFK